jgi:hypothetical protein
MIKIDKPIKKKPGNGIVRVELNGEVDVKEWIRGSFERGGEYKREVLLNDGKRYYKCFGVFPCDVRKGGTMFMYESFREVN